MDSHRTSVCSEVNMKIILLLLASTSLCWATPLQLSYHSAVGVPLAERIRAAEARGARTRVAGGVPANATDFPYFAGLLITLETGATSVCGATLLSATRLLSAAHCWWDGVLQARGATAVLGSDRLYSGGVRVSVEGVEIHPDYNPQFLSNDMMFLNVAVEYAPLTVSLPNGTFFYYEGTEAVLVGYDGILINDELFLEDNLSSGTVIVENNLECLAIYNFNVTDSTICASGRGLVGPCAGLSGGPLVTLTDGEHVLIGVSSFYAVPVVGCNLGLPSGYARVTSFLPWINAHL